MFTFPEPSRPTMPDWMIGLLAGTTPFPLFLRGLEKQIYHTSHLIAQSSPIQFFIPLSFVGRNEWLPYHASGMRLLVNIGKFRRMNDDSIIERLLKIMKENKWVLDGGDDESVLCTAISLTENIYYGEDGWKMARPMDATSINIKS
jgi:hypothetical protein